MALNSTVYIFTVRLADADRGVYETLELRLARHPSESPEFLVTRLLAYCLEHAEGLSFSKGGLSDPDQPALAVRDLTGQLQAWIEVGSPEALRLHKASKAAARVAVYPYRDLETWLNRLAGEKIHRAEAIEVLVFDRALLTAFVSRLERRMDLDLSISDRVLYATLGEETLTGAVESRRIAARA